jgi:hypothetical protein|tara:strand:+ start:1280 stop:1912 length:633 start_codon:yes stop_codon:yes gene_type:complete
MKAKTTVFGRILKCYNLPLEEVNDLNIQYEKEKSKLNSFGHRLAGRLDSELEFTNLIQSTNIFKSITDCLTDYIDTLEKVNLFEGNKGLEILSCWVNDMKEGEYNPPHTHHDLTGWSTVLFLKVPEYINDTKDPHKFKDGMLGFISHDSIGTTWAEPKVGEFYIFEAKHQHMVMPFKTKPKGKIRRTMSFNFVQKVLENERRSRYDTWLP